MKYDDIILDCSGDCNSCDVFMECQYQTSTGDEKATWLKKLEERDAEAAQAAAAQEVTATEVTEEAEAEEVAPAEAPAVVEAQAPCHEEAPVKVLTADEVKAIFGAVFGESYLAPLASCREKAEEKVTEAPEALAEATVEAQAPCHEEAPVKVLTADEVKAIFGAVFGESYLAPLASCLEKAEEKAAEAPAEEPAAPEAPKKEAKKPAPKKAPAKKQDEDEDEGEEEPEEEEEEEVEAEEEPEEEDEVDASENPDEAKDGETAEQKPVKEVFKLTPPENNDELLLNMCAKRQRKLIYRPNEVLIAKTFKVLGTDKKNEIGEKVKDILDAEIKQGVKLGYLDKFDGLKSSEIKEEYEDDVVYEYAEQEFKKTGVIYDGKDVKVYLYDWDAKACHHVGHVDKDEAAEIIPYLENKENFSFDVCGIITGGKAKRVVRVGDALKIVKEKGESIGLDVDIAIIKRKD